MQLQSFPYSGSRQRVQGAVKGRKKEKVPAAFEGGGKELGEQTRKEPKTAHSKTKTKPEWQQQDELQEGKIAIGCQSEPRADRGGREQEGKKL